MKKTLLSLASCAILSTNLFAETTASEFSLFKRTMSPSMNWGENGLMIVPKAQPIGKGNINFGFTTTEAGQIQGEKLFLTTGTLMIGTSEDVELGFTKRTFIWENGDRSDIEADSFHLKARVLSLTDYYTPQIAVGVNGSSLKANNFEDDENILFNPYVALSIPIRVFTDNFIISLTGVAETVYNEGDKTETMFSAGADMIIFETIYLMAEAQGLNQEEEDPVFNIGAKAKYGWFSIGGGIFNISQQKIQDGDINAQENKEQYWMLHANMEIPLLNLFGDDQSKGEEKLRSVEKPENEEKLEGEEINLEQKEKDAQKELEEATQTDGELFTPNAAPTSITEEEN